MHESRLMGAADAAKILGIDRATLGRWVRAGRIHPEITMPGLTGARLFTADEVARVRRELNRTSA